MRKHYRFPPLTVCRCGCPRSLWVEERGTCHSLWLVHVWFLIAVWLSLSLFLVSCHWEWRGWRGDVGFGWLFPEHPSSMLLAPTAVWLPPFAVEVSTRSRARTRHARAHRLIGVLERMPRTTPPSHSHRESGCSFSTYNPVRPPCKSARMQSRAPPPVARRGTPSREGGLLTPPRSRGGLPPRSSADQSAATLWPGNGLGRSGVAAPTATHYCQPLSRQPLRRPAQPTKPMPSLDIVRRRSPEPLLRTRRQLRGHCRWGARPRPSPMPPGHLSHQCLKAAALGRNPTHPPLNGSQLGADPRHRAVDAAAVGKERRPTGTEGAQLCVHASEGRRRVTGGSSNAIATRGRGGSGRVGGGKVSGDEA